MPLETILNKTEETESSDTQELSKTLDEFLYDINQLNGSAKQLLKKTKQKSLTKPVNKTRNSFLDLKAYLLLMYNICLSNFMLLKSEGKKIEGHPVIDHLIRLRVSIEKCRTIDKRLRYSIDKMLKLAYTEGSSYEKSGVGDSDSIEGLQSQNTEDPLSYRPRLLDTLEQTSLTSNQNKLENDSEPITKDSVSTTSPSAVYRPPKSVPVFYDDAKAQNGLDDEIAASIQPTRKQMRDARRQRQRLLRSTLVSNLRSELRHLDDCPEEIDSYGTGLHIENDNKRIEPKGNEEGNGYLMKQLLNKERYEEDNFLRLPETKIEKRMRKHYGNQIVNESKSKTNTFDHSLDIQDGNIHSSSLTEQIDRLNNLGGTGTRKERKHKVKTQKSMKTKNKKRKGMKSKRKFGKSRRKH